MRHLVPFLLVFTLACDRPSAPQTEKGRAAPERGSQPKNDAKGPADDKSTPDLKGTWISFLSHRSGYNILYRMRPDGNELGTVFGGPEKDGVAIPEELTLYREPHWTRQSPDRQWFLSWAMDRLRPDKEYKLPSQFVIRIGAMKGGPTRTLVTDADETCAWAPDSRRFAFAVYNRPPEDARDAKGYARSTRIRIMGAEGANAKTVLERPGLWNVSDWSPDGKKLLLFFTSSMSSRYGTADLLEYDLATALKENENGDPNWASAPQADKYLTMVTGGSTVRNFLDARYSPDGKSVAVIISRHLECPGRDFDIKDSELGVLELNPVTLRSLAKYPDGLRGQICWSPEGGEIVYSRFLKTDDDREKMGKGETGLGRCGNWSRNQHTVKPVPEFRSEATDPRPRAATGRPDPPARSARPPAG